MAEHSGANVLEAVHSGDACDSAIAELNHGHLADDPIENIYDDEVREASLPHPAITVVGSVFQKLERVKTTINSPGALETEKQKYSSSCSCDNCLKARAVAASASNQPAPIMITPYRHNWLISGMHRGNTSDEFFDFDTRFVKKTTELPSALPYFVKRTHVGNFPVYCETKSKQGVFGPVTVIGNIFGDVSRFQQDLRHAVVGGEPKIQTKPRKLAVHGNFENKIKQWLLKLGF